MNVLYSFYVYHNNIIIARELVSDFEGVFENMKNLCPLRVA